MWYPEQRLKEQHLTVKPTQAFKSKTIKRGQTTPTRSKQIDTPTEIHTPNLGKT